MRDFFSGVLDVFEAILTFLHDVLEPVFGVHSWGWAIIALTLVVRVLLLPLAIKQTRSMRAMQAIQPEMKALQKKYKVDRELMRKDPEKYRAKKAKLNEEMMALYKERGANPAASCLPLLAQAPVFLALFWTLNRMGSEGAELVGQPFYFFTQFGADDVEPGLQMVVSSAGWPGWLLILLMSGTMYWTQRQMMARTALTQGGENPMAQQQKILMYAMPIFLAVISFQFPMGILLYWVTTNVWQVAQQAIILREVKAERDSGELSEKPGGEPPKRRSPGASSGSKPAAKDGEGGAPTKGDKGGAAGDAPNKGKGSHAKDGKGSKGSGSAKDQPKGSASGKGDAKRTGSAKGGSDDRSTKPDRSDTSGNGSEKGGTPPKGSSSNGSSSNGSSPARRPSKRDHLPRRPRR